MSEQRVEAVERALVILEAFSDGTPSLSLSELTQRTQLYRSTTLRLAASLERFGYLYRDPTGRFRLGSALLRLGSLYQNSFDLADRVRPALQKLVDATQETAAFYIREGTRRICLFRLHSQRIITHHLEEGTVLPLDIGASARVLMAFTESEEGAPFDRVRAVGCHISLGERDPDAAAVSVPVFGAQRRFIGALGITGLKTHFEDGRAEQFAATMAGIAKGLSLELGGYYPVFGPITDPS